MDKKNEDFETAFTKLEEILEKMNSGQTSLDGAIVLYEEADKLIHLCQKRLNDAERKIELLTKKRNGELATDSENKPTSQEFEFAAKS